MAVSPSRLSHYLRNLQRTGRGMNAIVVREIRKLAPKAQREIAMKFEGEQYFGPTGRTRSVRTFSWAWFRRKLRLGLDARRGHATGGIQFVLHTKESRHNIPGGFEIDFLRGARGTSTAVPRGKGLGIRWVPMSDYLGHFADAKAPTLGEISERARDEIALKARAIVLDRLQRVGMAGAVARARKSKAGLEVLAEFNLDWGPL